jgi:hypothetical protein
MEALKYNILLSISFLSCSVFAQFNNIEIDNKLESCVLLNSSKIIFYEDIPILNSSFTNISKTASCGCKSAINNYTVYQLVDGFQSTLISSDFTFSGVNSLALPIAAQKKIIAKNAKIKVVISCSSPL